MTAAATSPAPAPAPVPVPARTVLITGASRGIGAATAWRCAERGWAVGVNYAHDEAAAQRVVERIRSAGGQALALHADVSDEAQVQAMFRSEERRVGKECV